MRRATSLFLLSFFVFQFACIGTRFGFAYCAENNVTDPREWDFGQVKQGEILKHDFLLKNETADVLKINSVNTSCGCTVSQSEKKSLKPGESTKISVSFNTRGYSGAVKQYVYVNTDSVDLAVIKFIIKAEVL